METKMATYKPRREAWNRCSLAALKRNSDFGLPASRAVRQYISVV